MLPVAPTPVAIAPETAPPAQADPSPFTGLVTKRRVEEVNNCLYRECRTGCQRSRCWAKLRGETWMDEPSNDVTMVDCCLCMRSR